jgi:hypothetical protein
LVWLLISHCCQGGNACPCSPLVLGYKCKQKENISSKILQGPCFVVNGKEVVTGIALGDNINMLLFFKQKLVLFSVPKTGTTALEAAALPYASAAILDPPGMKHVSVFTFFHAASAQTTND